MAMAGDPGGRGGAAHNEPGTRVRMASRACLHSAKYCRALWAILGTLLGAVSLLSAGRRHTPAGLRAACPPDIDPASPCPFLLVLLRGPPGLLSIRAAVPWRLAASRPNHVIAIGYAPEHTL